MSSEIASEFRQVGTDANGSIWGTEPLLSKRGSAYLGRIFVEVWEKDERVVIGGQASAQQALAVLEGKSSSVSVDKTPWTNDTVTGSSQQSYYGRVVVELWQDGGVVAISGANPSAVVAGAKRRLTALLGPKPS